jgi:membrane protease YdiL (CAAX protease family)
MSISNASRASVDDGRSSADDSVGFAQSERIWSYKGFLVQATLKTMKEVGMVAVQVITTQVVRGWVLGAMEAIAESHDMSSRNIVVLKISQGCYSISSSICKPLMLPTHIVEMGPNFFSASVLLNAFTEELLFRGLIQRVAMPAVSKLVPKSYGDLIGSKIFRITFTSAIFALAHKHSVSNPPFGAWPHFVGGVAYGWAAERYNGLFIAVLTHFLHNVYVYDNQQQP